LRFFGGRLSAPATEALLLGGERTKMGAFPFSSRYLEKEVVLVTQLPAQAQAIHDEIDEQVRASVRGDITKEEAHARVCATLVRLEALPERDRDALLRTMDDRARFHQARIQDGTEGLAQAELAMKLIEFAEELEPSSGPNLTAAEAIAILRRHGEKRSNQPPAQ
jgi:hypothetical protein